MLVNFMSLIRSNKICEILEIGYHRGLSIGFCKHYQILPNFMGIVYN